MCGVGWGKEEGQKVYTEKLNSVGCRRRKGGDFFNGENVFCFDSVKLSLKFNTSV